MDRGSHLVSSSMVDEPARRPYGLGRDEGEAYWIRGNRFDFKASGREVGGGFAVVETLLHPVSAAPAHVHHETDEAVYVVEGHMTVDVGDERLELGEGSFAFLPRGIPHRYLPRDPGPVRVLWVLSPGGFEDFWREMGTPVQPGEQTPQPMPPDPESMARLGQKYKTEFLP